MQGKLCQWGFVSNLTVDTTEVYSIAPFLSSVEEEVLLKKGKGYESLLYQEVSLT